MGVYYKTFFKKSAKDLFLKPKVKNNNSKNKYVYNVPCAFDIETTNFEYNGMKFATMYHWQFAIDDVALNGRTWEEFIDCIDELNKAFLLNENLNLICYVHNLGFEFQFIKKKFKIEKLFAREPRKPMYFIANNIIFKDSLILSGMGLKRTLEEAKVKHSKTDGLDYNLLRHFNTYLNDEEIEYCDNDVLGLCEYIRTEMKKNDNNISKIPTTKTGYARRYTRNKCFENNNYKNMLTEQLTTDKEAFTLLQDCFSGAYTHANFLKVGIEFENVGSYDFTSSYPSVMLRHKYPSSKWYESKPNDINSLINMCVSYCCIMYVTFENLEPKNIIHPLSVHRCSYDKNSLQEDNGKVVRCNYITTAMTSIDLIDFVDCYSFDNIKIHKFYFCNKQYLPKEFIIAMLELYKNKTTLKGIKGKEDVYLLSKGLLNSLYGMSVTNPIAPDVKFNDNTKEWSLEENKNLITELINIKNSKQTFLNYAWGVFIVAYARHELYDGIKHTIDDFIYADTDSIKITNPNKYQTYFNEYNNKVLFEVNMCLMHHHLNYSDYIPKNSPIGVWDYEGMYDKFKTLGAKKYAYIKNGKFNYTVAGLPKINDTDKNTPLKWIIKDNDTGLYGMDYFNIDLNIPKEYSCKLCSTYIDEPFEVELTDYLGNTEIVKEDSCLHLGSCSFKINFSDCFLDFLLGIDNPYAEILRKIFKRKF